MAYASDSNEEEFKHEIAVIHPKTEEEKNSYHIEVQTAVGYTKPNALDPIRTPVITVITKGDKVSQSQAAILDRLKICPFE